MMLMERVGYASEPTVLAEELKLKPPTTGVEGANADTGAGEGVAAPAAGLPNEGIVDTPPGEGDGLKVKAGAGVEVGVVGAAAAKAGGIAPGAGSGALKLKAGVGVVSSLAPKGAAAAVVGVVESAFTNFPSSWTIELVFFT